MSLTVPDQDWFDKAPIQVSVEVIFDVTPEEVFSLIFEELSSLFNWGQAMGVIEVAFAENHTSLIPGAVYNARSDKLFTFKMLVHQPPIAATKTPGRFCQAALSISSSPFVSMLDDHRIEYMEDGRTRLKLRKAVQTTFLMSAMSGFIRTTITGKYTSAGEKMKAIVAASKNVT